MKDTLFDTEQNIVDFTFDEKVVSVFPDMINRSVPGYPTIIKMIGMLAARYVTAGSNCYDLGCSLGASTLSMRQHIEHEGVTIHAIDNSQAMLDQFDAILHSDDVADSPVHVITSLDDVATTPINNASMVVLNFTLQFIDIEKRQSIIQTIYDGLNEGGILVLSEKVKFEDDAMNNLMIDLHHNFKRSQGYSDLEIAQKRNAIENVLIPETLDTHLTRFNQAGFSSADIWFQCLNFASLVAVK